MNLVVDYKDLEEKARWGYLTHDGVKMFDEYLKKIRQQDKEGEGANEILDTNIKQLGRMTIKVYHPDGTIGTPEVRHITIVTPFVQYKLKPKEEIENKDE